MYRCSILSEYRSRSVQLFNNVVIRILHIQTKGPQLCPRGGFSGVMDGWVGVSPDWLDEDKTFFYLSIKINNNNNHDDNNNNNKSQFFTFMKGRRSLSLTNIQTCFAHRYVHTPYK